MKAKLTLRTLDQVRALADPLRLRIVEVLVAAEQPVAEVARAVGVPLTRLYHHIDLLLETGLIEVVRRVPRRGVEERVFRATARRFVLAENLFAVAPGPAVSTESILQLARTVLGGGLDDLVEGLKTGRVAPGQRGRGVVLENRRLRMSAAGFQALATELPALLDQLAQRYGVPDGETYRVAFATFPTGSRDDGGPADTPPKEPTRPRAAPRARRRSGT